VTGSARAESGNKTLPEPPSTRLRAKSTASNEGTIIIAPGDRSAVDPRDMTPAQLSGLEEEERRIKEAIKEVRGW
jgi:hypothetical protein